MESEGADKGGAMGERWRQVHAPWQRKMEQVVFGGSFEYSLLL